MTDCNLQLNAIVMILLWAVIEENVLEDCALNFKIYRIATIKSCVCKLCKANYIMTKRNCITICFSLTVIWC